ncbi:MAG: type II/IV secretion system ATPase subunit [Candidatus Thermoplasmatota archaeon]|nr:type II/IV secretion system ATPase subunit [Candidatus Thermoplasmatota archaeon]
MGESGRIKVQDTCPYTVQRRADRKTIVVNCRSCTLGNSTLSDQYCRSQLFSILQHEYGAQHLILNHALVKVFSGNDLDILHCLTRFIDGIETCSTGFVSRVEIPECETCFQHPQRQLTTLLSLAHADPVAALSKIHDLTTQPLSTITTCQQCMQEFRTTLHTLVERADILRILPPLESLTSDVFYTTHIRPYVRPGFIDSYIHLEPPADAVFLESYDVQGRQGRALHVSLYLLKTRPEKLYFVVPSEYDLSREELYLLERVREQLSRHHPKDASFLDAETSREYFHHFGRQVLSRLIQVSDLRLSMERMEYLADLFARYTAGLGILEDLLSDARIQDIYVNAPVTNNPLHLVVDGEEYTSNIFLSPGDVDALASRFRALSGRAFSEANPVLDMDLRTFSTRVAAIANPLTPKGTAFALRRHRQHPWTLAHFIANRMISAEAAGLLSFLVDGQASLLIAGSRGSGKTSLLGALMLEIPQRFRILTIEDTAEIPVEQLQHLGYKIQSLITRSMSMGAASSEVDPTDALRTALRLGESVLVLGEVRGVEAKVLFEAMRIGAAGNLIMGTIHGSTTRDVYERVVYDIGVPPTSFKAVDGIVIAAPIRVEGGMERKRRVTQLSEITKTGWTTNPDSDSVFQNLMVYQTSCDELQATDLLDMGQSQIVIKVAQKWGITVEKALQNIKLRTWIKKTVVERAQGNVALLEAPVMRDVNNAFWMLLEEAKTRAGGVDYDDIQQRWVQWFSQYVG